MKDSGARDDVKRGVRGDRSTKAVEPEACTLLLCSCTNILSRSSLCMCTFHSITLMTVYLSLKSYMHVLKTHLFLMKTREISHMNLVMSVCLL